MNIRSIISQSLVGQAVAIPAALYVGVTTNPLLGFLTWLTIDLVVDATIILGNRSIRRVSR